MSEPRWSRPLPFCRNCGYAIHRSRSKTGWTHSTNKDRNPCTLRPPEPKIYTSDDALAAAKAAFDEREKNGTFPCECGHDVLNHLSHPSYEGSIRTMCRSGKCGCRHFHPDKSKIPDYSNEDFIE